MKTKILLTVPALCVLGFIQMAVAKDIIHCRQLSGKPVEGTLTDFRVSEAEDGGYIYNVNTCMRYGSMCTVSNIYESHGLIERDSYNGRPTLIFKNNDIKSFPSCGTYEFIDEKQGVDIMFMFQECQFSKE